MSWILGAFGVMLAIINILYTYVFDRAKLTHSVTEWVKVSGCGIIGMIAPNITDLFEISSLVLKFLSSLFGAIIVGIGAWKAYKETFKNVKQSENDK
jgi:hypothetical protein